MPAGAYSEAMTQIILERDSNLPQDAPYPGHVLGLCQWSSIFKLKRKKCPGVASPCHIRNNAVTGHKASAVHPKNTVTPLPNWSHFDRFRYTQMGEGCCKESQATLPHAWWTDGSKAAAEGTVISPAQKKTKKQVTAVAHNIIV